MLATARAEATYPGADGVIVFSASPEANKLYSTALDGTGTTRITQTPNDQNFAAWSPDGNHVAFLEYGAGWTWLVVGDPSGVHTRHLEQADYAERPQWSPDGTWIAFVQAQNIAVVHPDGSGFRILGPGLRPEWSPDGQSIAATTGHLLLVYDVLSGHARTVTTVSNIAALPSWSPDARQIAFTETNSDASTYDIHVVNADGTADHIVTGGWQAAWSPAGDELAVLRSFYAPQRLDVVRLDGSLAATIDTNASFNASWSPDGTMLAYTTGTDPNELDVSSADGAKRGVVVAAQPGTYVADPVWMPDGSRLLYTQSRAAQGVELYALDPRDDSMRQLTDAGVLQSDPAWSPDGTTLAVAAPHGIELLRSDGSFVRWLTAGPDAKPTWSPDGSRIAFTRGGRILETRVDRTRVRRVTGGTDPAWSPAGGTLAFAHGGNIWTVRPDGSGAHVLLEVRRVNGAKALTDPRWAPDGRSLLVDEYVQVGLDLVPNVIRIDARTRNVRGLGVGTPSAWSPDGTAIVSAKTEPDGASAVVVTGPDGSAPNELAMSLSGGPGSFSWQPTCTLSGDDGPNVLRASSAGDVVCALGGNDRISGGHKPDRIFAGAGNDTIDVRGGGFDVVGCGPGNDTVYADHTDYVGVDCEHVKR